MPLLPPFPCALGSCGAWAMYCAQPSSTQTSHWVPTFPSNASAHIPHLGSAQCFSKQYLCPPHSLSFPFAFRLTSLTPPRVLAFLLRSPFLFPTASVFNKPINPLPAHPLSMRGDIPSMAQERPGNGPGNICFRQPCPHALIQSLRP